MKFFLRLRPLNFYKIQLNLVKMRSYTYGNYSEWKVEALKMTRDFYQDVLDYDTDINDEFRKELEVGIKKINEWLGELSKQKKDTNKSPEVLAWKIKILEEIKENIEINMEGSNECECDCGCDEDAEELKEMYQEELKYAKRWLKELKG